MMSLRQLLFYDENLYWLEKCPHTRDALVKILSLSKVVIIVAGLM